MSSVNTSEKTYLGLQGRNLGLLISTIATTGFLLFGYDQGVMSGIINAAPFNAYFPETKGNSVYQGFVTAIYEVGCLFGAVLSLTCGEKFGRRKLMMTGGIIMILGVIIQITAMTGHNATAQFIIGRTITGFGNGINTSTIPTYQAECSRTSNRGLLICIEGGVIAFGTLIAYWIDYGCSYAPESLSGLTWRFPIAFQIIFGVILVVGTFFLPESPRWLISKDRHEEGLTVLAALRGVSVRNPDAILEKTLILDSIAASGKSGSFKTMFTGGKTQHFRRMLLGSSAQLFQQIGGCNAVIYYFPILFESSIAPGNANLALLMGGVNMIVYSIFATASWFIIEKVGRRQLFLWGTVGQCLSMVLVFACLIPGTKTAAYGSAVGLFTYIASFGASWLPLPWLYPAEINPLRTRAHANATSTITNWTFNFLIVMVTPVMISSIGWGTYLFFAVVNACFIPVIYFFYPETKRRSLEEIDLIFAKGYLENMSYVKASKEMPYLNDREVREMAREYGFIDQDEESKVGEKGSLSDEQTSDIHSAPAVKRSSSDDSAPQRRAVDHSKHEGFLND